MRARKILVMAGISAGLWVGLPGTALAGPCSQGATYPAKCPPPPKHKVDVIKPRPHVVTKVVVSRAPARQVGRAAQGGLPVTGGDVVGLTVMGLGAVGIGTLLVRRSRSIA